VNVALDVAATAVALTLIDDIEVFRGLIEVEVVIGLLVVVAKRPSAVVVNFVLVVVNFMLVVFNGLLVVDRITGVVRVVTLMLVVVTRAFTVVVRGFVVTTDETLKCISIEVQEADLVDELS
jgi:hypothetical protein